MSYNTLVISGGGIKGIKFLGALHYLYTNNYLNNVNYYAGTSIGSLLSLLLCIGYTPLELITYICKYNILHKKLFFDIFSMMNGHGALEYYYFNEIIEKIILNKIGILPTLGKIKELYGSDIMLTTYNYTNSKVEYISSSTHPDINCMTAIRMSCNIPLVFGKYSYNNCDYIDGAIYDIFPINYFLNSENASKFQIIGITITFEQNFSNETNIIHYIHDLFFIPIKEVLKSAIERAKRDENNKIIMIKDEKLQSWNLQSTKFDMLNMFSDGYDESKNNLESC